MSYLDRLSGIQATIDAIRSRLQRGDLPDGLIFDAVRIWSVILAFPPAPEHHDGPPSSATRMAGQPEPAPSGRHQGTEQAPSISTLPVSLAGLGTFASIGHTGMVISWGGHQLDGAAPCDVPAREAPPARPPSQLGRGWSYTCHPDASAAHHLPTGKARIMKDHLLEESVRDELASGRPAHPLEVGVGPVSNAALSPLSFLERSARVWPDKIAIIYGRRRLTYSELAAEAQRVARALQASGVEPGDRVAYLMPNLPEMLIAHFAVPLAGGVLVTLNTRLTAGESPTCWRTRARRSSWSTRRCSRRLRLPQRTFKPWLNWWLPRMPS